MIGYVKQESTQVRVFDEKGAFKFLLNGTLVSYTSTTIIVRQGNTNYMYNENNRFLRQWVD